jgi:hypothetical protein
MGTRIVGSGYGSRALAEMEFATGQGCLPSTGDKVMGPEAVFKIANSLALLGWIVLVIFGWQRRVSGLVTAVVLPLAFAALYTLVVALHAGESSGDFNSLSGVAALFSHRWFLLAGWVHYLAFDLFIGSWEVRDAAAQRIPHWAVVPCLILTFLLGPVGLLLYFTLRVLMRRQFQIT